jgi:hypothetical protein
MNFNTFFRYCLVHAPYNVRPFGCLLYFLMFCFLFTSTTLFALTKQNVCNIFICIFGTASLTSLFSVLIFYLKYFRKVTEIEFHSQMETTEGQFTYNCIAVVTIGTLSTIVFTLLNIAFMFVRYFE